MEITKTEAAKKAAHTPGPWHVAGYGILGPEAKLKDSIAVTSVRSRNRFGVSKFEDQEREANARLIAAAPETAAERDRLKKINADLLAALKDLCAASSPFRPGHRAIAEVDASTIETALAQAFVIITKSSEAA